MLRKVEKTAKNKDEALKLAAEELGVTVEELDYEVVREAKGLMKLLAGSEAEIVAWIKAEADAEKKQSEKKAEKKEEKKAERTEKKTAPKAERPAKREEKDIIIPKTAVDDAILFLKGLLSRMGLEAELHVKLDNAINIDVSGEKMGLLIGKRGDTLDAVQYLTSLHVNRNKGQYIKVNVDTENYRAKREETLVHLARGLQRSVLRDKKPITLEPMSPNERRIIHSALQHNKNIRTYSIGEEPNRKVVVDLAENAE